MRNIVIIGSGVVGEATGRGFIRKGHSVTFVDVNVATIAKLNAAGLDARLIEAVDWTQAEIVMLAVSTPTKAGCNHQLCKPPNTTRPPKKNATSRPSRRMRRS